MPKQAGAAGLRVSLEPALKRVVIAVVTGEGDKAEVVRKDDFDGAKVHPDLRERVFLYGLSKVLQDRTSDTKDKLTKLAEMRDVMDRLEEGKWEKDRVVGVAPVVSAEVEALSRIKSISIPAAQAALRGYDKEQREKILANPKIVEMALGIRAEREKAGVVDLSDLT